MIKNPQNGDKPHFQDEEYQKRQQTPYFHISWKSEITVSSPFWGLENVNDVVTSINCCPSPTENVLGGSITHIESPCTLIITSISLTSSGDLILGPKTRFITILAGFMSRSHREVARLGSESIELSSIRTRYIHFLRRHT